MGETTGEIRSGGDWQHNTPERAAATGVAGTNKVDLRAADIAAGNQEEAQIRSGIEQTRADMSETIDALQDKLDPARIAEQVKDRLREKAVEAYDNAKNTVKEATIGRAGKIVANVSETVSDVTQRAGTAVRNSSSSFVEYVRENPVPFALLGIGVGMLAYNASKQRPAYRSTLDSYPDEYGTFGAGEWDANARGRSARGRARDAGNGMADTARSAAGSVADTARETAARASSAVSSAASSVRGAASQAADATVQQWNQVSDQARHGAQVASDRFQITLQENPLALGVAALAAGAILGFSLPASRVENEYLGKAREQLMNRAKSAAQDTLEKVQRVTEEAGRTVKDAAQKEGLTVGERASAQTA